MNERVIVPQLCEFHMHDLVVLRLKLSPETTWRARVIVANMLLFQYAAWRGKSVDDIVAGGCILCQFPEAMDIVHTMLLKDGKHVADVIYLRASDPDWPVKPT